MKFKINDIVVVVTQFETFISIIDNDEKLEEANNKYDDIFLFNSSVEQAKEIIALQQICKRLYNNYEENIQRIELLEENIRKMIFSKFEN